MSVREDLAAAASSVEGISVQPYFNQTTKAGSGMVRMDRTDYPNVFGGIVTWQILVMLPQDIAQAEKYLEAKAPALVAALSEHMVVRTVAPQQIQIEGAQILPALVISGTREE